MTGQHRIRYLPDDAKSMHRRAALSSRSLGHWRNRVSAVTWKNFTYEGLYTPSHKKKLQFPDRKQCPWQMRICTQDPNVSFKVAMQSSKAMEKVADSMTEHEFVRLNKAKCLALGVYKTTCTPWPMVVYYALSEGLKKVPEMADAQ